MCRQRCQFRSTYCLMTSDHGIEMCLSLAVHAYHPLTLGSHLSQARTPTTPMVTTRFACVLALLLCSAAPSLAEDSPNFARRLTQLGFLQGFANFAGTAPVTADTVANTNNPAIDPLQPGCTDYVLIFNACSVSAWWMQQPAGIGCGDSNVTDQ